MRGLPGKRVLISGGSSGIGQATAQRFLEEGARVFLCGLDPDEVDAAVAGLAEFGTAAGIAADVSREDDVTRLVESACEALGGIDVLINNAGVAWREPFLRITPSHWDRMIAVNLRGMFRVAQAVARVLVDQGGGGVILNMSFDERPGRRGGLRPLQRVQGRRAAADQDHGGRTRAAWHPGQRPVSRIHRDAAERGHQRGPRRAGVR